MVYDCKGRVVCIGVVCIGVVYTGGLCTLKAVCSGMVFYIGVDAHGGGVHNGGRVHLGYFTLGLSYIGRAAHSGCCTLKVACTGAWCVLCIGA